MPPIFGLFALGLAAIVVVTVCFVSFLCVGFNPAWRVKRTAWLFAGLPTMAVVLFGMSCALSNERETALAEAVAHGDAVEVRRLLYYGVTADARVNPSDPYGSLYAIHTAIDDRRWDLVSF